MAEVEGRRREEEVAEVRGRLSLLAARLAVAEEEREVVRRDAAMVNHSREERMTAAWTTRWVVVAGCDKVW